jgi:O-antigen/teichoic acid export membrane protein
MAKSTSSSRSMFDTMVVYAGSRYFRQVSGVLLAILRPKLLGPNFYGLWTLFKVIPRYSRFMGLGAREALRFFLPYHRERGDTKRAQAITDSVFMATGFIHGVVGVALLLLCLFAGFSKEAKFGLVCMALFLPLEFFVRHVITILRAEARFSTIARYNYIESVAVFVLTIPLLYWFRIYGVFLSFLLTRLVIAGLMFREGGLRARARFQARTFAEMVRKGFPIMMSDFCIELITTSDRLIISLLLGQTALGYYGIAVMVLAILIQLPGTAREIMEPEVMQNMDGRATETFVDEYLLKPLVNTAYLMPFLIGPVCLALPVGIPLLLPRYLEGIVPTQIAALGVFFLALAFVPRPIIVANGWQSAVAKFLPLVLLVNVGVSVALVRAGYGILGVALGSSLSFALLFLTLFVFIAKRLHVHSRSWRRHVMALALPFPAMCLVLFGVAETLSRILHNVYVCGSVQIIVYTGLMAGFHVLSSRRFELLNGLALWR